MWDLRELEELESEINERQENEFYERACTLFYLGVGILFGGVMTVFVLSILGHLK